MARILGRLVPVQTPSEQSGEGQNQDPSEAEIPVGGGGGGGIALAGWAPLKEAPVAGTLSGEKSSPDPQVSWDSTPIVARGHLVAIV